MATIHDVARLAGVGIGTVSRVVNHGSHVRIATREKVQRAIEQLHYKPDPIARSMISRLTGSLGVILPLFTYSSCREVLQGMEAAAARLEYQLVLYNVRDSTQRDHYFSDLPMHRKVDGVIILSFTPEDAVAQEIRKVGLPVVLVDAYSPYLPSLVIQTKQGIVRVVKGLLHQGHHRIGWLTDVREEKTRWNETNEVYLRSQTQREEGCIIKPEYIFMMAQNKDEGRKAAFQMLSRPDPPTAMIVTSALLATGVLEAAQTLDLAVPDALSVICLNNGELAEWLELSTLQLPMDEMGEWGVRHLVDQIEKPAQSPILHTCEMTFVERRTTKHLVLR